VVNLALVALLWLDMLLPWHLIAVAAVEGVAFSCIAPAMRSLVSELVPPDTLMNAVSVAAVVEGAMVIVGGVVAGILIETVGPEAVYAGVALLLTAASVALLQLPTGMRGGSASRKMSRDLYFGVRHMMSRPVLIALLGLSFARNLFGGPYVLARLR
jgi:MFS family permease